MDIQHAIAPMTPMQAKPEANDKPSESADASSARTGFLQLLQGLTTPEVAEAVDTNAVVATAAAAGAATDAVGVDALRVEASAHTAEVLADGVPVPMPTVSPTMAEQSSSEVLGETFDVAHLIGLLDINSLVNQTHRLDTPTQDVDATHLQQAFMGTSPAAGAAAYRLPRWQRLAPQQSVAVRPTTQQRQPLGWCP
jgi:hypothetical protein